MIKGIRPSLAQAGHIKIGRKSDQERTSKSGKTWRAPQKLDHFLVTKTMRGRDGNLEVDDAIMKALAKQGFSDSDGNIRSIPIVLHSDDIDDVFPTAYAWYYGAQCVCRGDGEKATRWEVKDGKKTGRTKERPCPCECLERDEKGVQRCKPNGVLHCTIALDGYAVAGAVYRYRTTGIISVQRVIGSLEQILAIVGTITNVPLVLRVTPVQVAPDGQTQTVYSVHVELRQDVIRSQQQALEARKARAELGGPPVHIRALLQPPASDDEPPEEQAEVEAEFYPQTDEQPPQQEKRSESVKDAAKKTASGKNKTKAANAKEAKKELEKTKQQQMKDVTDDYDMIACINCGAACPEKATICHTCGQSIRERVTNEEPPPHDDDDMPDYGEPDA